MAVVYSLNHNFIKSVERHKGGIAIETLPGDKGQTLSYSDLYNKVRSFAYFISSQGIKKSDRVALILENRPEWSVVFFALSYVGAVAVPLDPGMPDKNIKSILSDSGAKHVFISEENQKLYIALKDSATVIAIEKIETIKAPEGFKPVDIDPEDLMVILYTSGTTDLPKGVMLTHKNLCANFNSLHQMKVFSQRDVILSLLPLYHSYSLMTTLIAPIFSGSKVVYAPSDWPEKLTDYMKQVGATIFLGVPQLFHMIHSRMMKKLDNVEGMTKFYIKLAISLRLTKILLPKIRKAFGKRLRFFISGGAKLDPVVAGDFFKLGFKILEGYGLTETSPVASMNPLKRPKIGSIGRPIPDVELKVINKDASGVGEIAIKGPNVMKGYYRNEAKTREVIKEDWFLSGDLGYSDKEGYFYITGRSKEMIVLSSGKNIYPEEIEKHYSVTPYIKEICVLGVLKKIRSGGKLEYLHAVVVPDLEFFKERGEMNIRRVIKNTFDNLSKDIPAYRHIMGFTVTQENLSRTVLGKLKRYEIEKKFMPIILDEREKEKDVAPEDKELSKSENAQKLIKCIKDTLDIKGPVRLNDSIELDLGVDSLGSVELLLTIEKCFDIEFPEEMVAGEIFAVKDVLVRVEEILGRKAQGSRLETVGKEKAISWPDIIRQPLAGEFKNKILLKAGWLDYLLTFLIKGSINIFFRVFYSLRVEGTHRIPKKGPYVLCANHTSFLDGFVVTAGVPFKVQLDLFFIGFRRYFIVPIVRDMVRWARIIPIDATQIVEAMQASHFILTNNKALCIFPEGERSIDGEVKEFKKGIGIIARELDIPLVPVYIRGVFEAWPRTKPLPRLHPIKIIFGEPVLPGTLIKQGLALGARDEYEAICIALREKLLTLHGGGDG